MKPEQRFAANRKPSVAGGHGLFLKRRDRRLPIRIPTRTLRISFLLTYEPTQCIFWLGGKRKSYHERTFEYCRPIKITGEVEKHLKKFAPDDEVLCPHPKYKAANLVLLNVMTFKNHTAKVRRIFLRV